MLINTNDYLAERFLTAADLLPYKLRSATMSVPETLWLVAEEIRLRAGRRLSLVVPSGEVELSADVTALDVAELVNTAARGSLHSVADALGAGFITAAGGHRVGVCGSAVLRDGSTVGMRSFSSANLRVAKEIRGVADTVFQSLNTLQGIPSTLIISPPGGGKTTLLRDLVRLVSDGGQRVAVADERCEIAALSNGVPGFDLGAKTDVLEGSAKADAALTLLRAMNPQVIALDELTDPQDIAAVERVSGCGVAVIATIHARSSEDLRRRGLSNALKLFDKMVYINVDGNHKRTFQVEDISH